MRLSGMIMRCCVLCVLAIGLAWAAVAEEVPKPIAAGKKAPSFSLPALAGSRQTLSVWCGKLSKPYINETPHVVVLSFWATYCKPCQKEIPELMKFAEKHTGEAIKVFCISLDKEGASSVAPFVKKHNYTLPSLLDPYKRTAQRYGVKSLPALVVVGPDGVVRYSSVGFKEDVSLVDLLDKVVEAARENRNYSAGAVEMKVGESVDVRPDDEAGGGTPELTPKDKWEAVARVECGESLADVAKELGVKSDVIKKWYDDLKAAAISLWKTQR